MNTNPGSIDDPQITTYALGELPPTDCAAFEKLLTEGSSMSATVNEIRAMATLITEAFALETVEGGNAGSAETNNRQDYNWCRTKNRSFMWVAPAALAAAACLAVLAIREKARRLYTPSPKSSVSDAQVSLRVASPPGPALEQTQGIDTTQGLGPLSVKGTVTVDPSQPPRSHQGALPADYRDRIIQNELRKHPGFKDLLITFRRPVLVRVRGDAPEKPAKDMTAVGFNYTPHSFDGSLYQMIVEGVALFDNEVYIRTVNFDSPEVEWPPPGQPKALNKPSPDGVWRD
jgi:hypothetical protein